MNAICNYCNQEMTPEHPCTLKAFEDVPGVKLPRIPYGSEDQDWGADSGRPCHDCNTPPGGFHHPGCDVERCFRCKRQAISCSCGPEAETD